MSRALPASVDSYRQAARRALPAAIFDFLDGGAEAECTHVRNRAIYDHYGIRVRLRQTAGQVDTSCRLLGHVLSMPLVIAPTGGLNLFWPQGEAAVAKAAATAGIMMALSAGASMRLEDVATAAPCPKWFQVCIYKDWSLMRDLMARAKAAGYAGLCVTLDGGLVGKRERDIKNQLGFTSNFVRRHIFDLLLHWPWSMRALRSLPFSFPNFPPAKGEQSLAAHVTSLTDPCPTWQHVERLRQEWSGPLILKAVASAADAARAVSEGITAIVVSNHGGRQFDGGLSTLELLPDIVQTVAGRIPVLIDGGISRGSHILKALALGANACVVGRAHLWGLSVAGETGARHVLEILRQELIDAMSFCGIDRLDQASPALIAKRI